MLIFLATLLVRSTIGVDDVVLYMKIIEQQQIEKAVIQNAIFTDPILQGY